MKYLGYVIQLLCIIALLKGRYTEDCQLYVYALCLLGSVNLLYNVVRDCMSKNRKSH